MRTRLAGFAVSLVALGTALVGPTQTAHAAGTLDQEQDVESGHATVLGEAVAGVPLSNAQTFTAGRSGRLSTVALKVARIVTTEAPLLVEIRPVVGGAPGSAVLAAAAVPSAQVPEQPAPAAWTTVDFSAPAALQAGVQYALVLRAEGRSGYVVSIAGGDPYARGSQWTSVGSWSAQPAVDLAFRTYVSDDGPSYGTAGFAAPVDMSTPARRVWNTVKGGRTVPLKFEVFDAATGSEVTDVAVVGSFTTTRVACDSGTANEDPVELVTTGGTALRYDEASGQFVQSWRTPTTAGSCYQVTVTLVDGSVIDQAFFEIK